MNVHSCRLCAEVVAEPSVLLNILEDNHLLQIIERHIFIKIDPDDHLSHAVCKTCHVTIKNWHSFWIRCVKIQQTLRTVTSSQNFDLQNLVPEALEPSKNFHVETVSSSGKTKNTYCLAKWCNNNNFTCSMFRLPKNQNRREKWLINMGRKDLLDSDFSKGPYRYLCAKHFKNKMFTNCKKERLNRTAIPTIFSQPYKDTDEMASLEKFTGSVSSLNTLQDESDWILTGGKLRRILPKNSDRNSSAPSSIIAGNSLKTSNVNNLEVVNKDKSQISLKVGVIGGKGKRNPPNLLRTKVVNRGASPSIIGNNSVSQATTANPRRNLTEPIFPGRAEEESVMTYDDPDFPASSSLVFQESVHRCTFCGEVFAIKNSLSNHLKTYHLNL